MENKLIPAILGVVVSIILIGTILVPVIHDAQSTAGDIVIYNNDAQMTTYREAVPGDVLKVYRTEERDIWELNGEIVNSLGNVPVASWNDAIQSDAIYVRYFDRSNASVGVVYFMDESVGARPIYFNNPESAPTTITFGDGTVTINQPVIDTWTVPYTWAYVPCNLGDATYMASSMSNTGGYVHDASDVVLCGNYTTGSNATTYWYRGGIGWNYADYGMDVSITLDKVDGTTDVYLAKSVVDIGGEEFNPYRMLVPYEVVGHEDKGTAISIYGIIPLVVLVAVLLSVIPVIRSRND